MNTFNKTISIVILILLLGCREENGYTGYIEGDFVQVATSLSGTLLDLNVERGDLVDKKMLLYRLDPESELYRKEEAIAELESAKFEYEDLTKGKRKEEIESLEMSVNQAKTALELAKIEYERQQKLRSVGGSSQEELDKAKANFESSTAQLLSSEAQLRLGRLGAREDQIAAANAKVKNAEAALRLAQWRLNEKSVYAPSKARVQDTLYREGEWVNAGAPVIVLLPPENVKARFFIKERDLGKIKIGQEVRIRCDSCPEIVSSTINFISEEAEFTPPVIFSRESRNKLVFMVEAKIPPEKTDFLRPGQPIDVSIIKDD